MYYYILILIGIIIIIAGKKVGKADNNTDFYDYFEPQNHKDDVNTSETMNVEKNYENIIDKTSDIQQRMDYLEQSIVLLDEKLDKNTNDIIFNLKINKEINSYKIKSDEKISNDETKSSEKINNTETKSAQSDIDEKVDNSKAKSSESDVGEKIDNGETKSSENNTDEKINNDAAKSVESDIDEKIDNDETKNSENNIDETIYKLYNEGKSIDEISSILKIGKGEIQLRIGLKKQIKR
ncbi:MAG TPA: hypothetical protein DEF85_09220 [Clostridiaceae bacterium]|jgi:hypothetical protein|nr:hypothetical protein [Clostridiaceae bacterium]HBF76311.1 hypothetical protein [Clostridiaceae bacterium]HBG39053.1 hypothetical protein [Clostridiaceae bacterium]HBN27650.1 hypothetical protein [Clostridiaceae bacterium]HBX49056.1 hypothetical protein [Clostridiaceae bacterium]